MHEEENNNRILVIKTIRMEPELIDKIEDIAMAMERDFSAQVRYMLKRYIEIIEEK
jgi:predicted transcriptional regulator